MSSTIQHAQEDLAFLRQLVENDRGEEVRRRFGFLYMLWGACWGPYLLLVATAERRLVTLTTATQDVLLSLVALITVAMTVIEAVRARAQDQTLAVRAFRAAFRGIALSYLTVLSVLLWLADRFDDSSYVSVFSVVVFAGQGAGWYLAWALRRKAWLAAVAAGWYVCAAALGFSIGFSAQFALVAGLSVLVLMGLPGWAMMRGKST